jgi:hypothetical protein
MQIWQLERGIACECDARSEGREGHESLCGPGANGSLALRPASQREHPVVLQPSPAAVIHRASLGVSRACPPEDIAAHFSTAERLVSMAGWLLACSTCNEHHVSTHLKESQHTSVQLIAPELLQ